MEAAMEAALASNADWNTVQYRRCERWSKFHLAQTSRVALWRELRVVLQRRRSISVKATSCCRTGSVNARMINNSNNSPAVAAQAWANDKYSHGLRFSSRHLPLINGHFIVFSWFNYLRMSPILSCWEVRVGLNLWALFSDIHRLDLQTVKIPGRRTGGGGALHSELMRLYVE